MLDLRSASVQPPAFIPSSAYAVGVFNLDIKTAFDELAKIIGAASPAYASILYTPLIPASAEGGASIELKKDIIDYLGSQIVYTEWPLKSPSEKIADSEGILAIAVSNRPALEKNLALLHSKFIAPNRPDAKRELLGYTIYSIGPSSLMPSLPFSYHAPLIDDAAVSDNRASSKIAFTITDTHLIFGSEQAVEKVIRLIGGPAGSSLGSEQWFTAAKSAIPSTAGLADFTNAAAVWERVWDVFKQGTAEQKDEAFSGPLAAQRILPSASDTPFDFKLLPPFQAVRKYFAPSTFYGISRPDGFYFEMQYINQTP